MKPTINLTYIENLDGYLPPSQTSLVSPVDGEILYDVNGGIVSSTQSVILEWNPLPSANSYKVFIKNNSGISVFDSKASSYIGFIGTKGVKERCIASNVFPHFTRIIGYGNPGTLTTTSITIDEGSAIEASPSSRTFNVMALLELLPI